MKIARLLAAAALVPMLMAAAPYWRGMAAGQVVVVAPDDIRLGAATSLSKAHWQEIGPPGQGPEEHSATWQLRSIVGPLVSVESHLEGMSEGAAHPYGVATLTAYDMQRGGRPARLTDYFPAGQIYAALMGDKLVRTALAGKARPKDLAQLVKAIAGYQSADCVWGFSDDLLSRFAFHHVQGNRVAVRFGLSHGCEVARGGLTILAIYLPVPKALAADLAAARTGKQGFLVPAAPAIVARAARRTP